MSHRYVMIVDGAIIAEADDAPGIRCAARTIMPEEGFKRALCEDLRTGRSEDASCDGETVEFRYMGPGLG